MAGPTHYSGFGLNHGFTGPGAPQTNNDDNKHMSTEQFSKFKDMLSPSAEGAAAAGGEAAAAGEAVAAGTAGAAGAAAGVSELAPLLLL